MLLSSTRAISPSPAPDAMLFRPNSIILTISAIDIPFGPPIPSSPAPPSCITIAFMQLLFSAVCRIRCSTVCREINRYTETGFFCPKRCARSCACESIAANTRAQYRA
eukprot:218536-Rhodomonas_salina.1